MSSSVANKFPLESSLLLYPAQQGVSSALRLCPNLVLPDCHQAPIYTNHWAPGLPWNTMQSMCVFNVFNSSITNLCEWRLLARFGFLSFVLCPNPATRPKEWTRAMPIALGTYRIYSIKWQFGLLDGASAQDSDWDWRHGHCQGGRRGGGASPALLLNLGSGQDPTGPPTDCIGGTGEPKSYTDVDGRLSATTLEPLSDWSALSCNSYCSSYNRVAIVQYLVT